MITRKAWTCECAGHARATHFFFVVKIATLSATMVITAICRGSPDLNALFYAKNTGTRALAINNSLLRNFLIAFIISSISAFVPGDTAHDKRLIRLCSEINEILNCTRYGTPADACNQYVRQSNLHRFTSISGNKCIFTCALCARKYFAFVFILKRVAFG